MWYCAALCLTLTPPRPMSPLFQGVAQYSAETDFGRSNSVLPTYVSYNSINGGQAFDRGLEEVRTVRTYGCMYCDVLRWHGFCVVEIVVFVVLDSNGKHGKEQVMKERSLL